ncbi:hypothetical protein BJ322DRAFT_1026608, partial [Thelephora terrestris]
RSYHPAHLLASLLVRTRTAPHPSLVIPAHRRESKALSNMLKILHDLENFSCNFITTRDYSKCAHAVSQEGRNDNYKASIRSTGRFASATKSA